MTQPFFPLLAELQSSFGNLAIAPGLSAYSPLLLEGSTITRARLDLDPCDEGAFLTRQSGVAAPGGIVEVA